MTSDKKRIVDDIFGDDDDDDDQSQNGDRDYEDRPRADEDGDRAEGQEEGEGDAAGSDKEDDIQLPSFKKRHADGESPTPEPKKKKLAKKPKLTDGAGVAADGSELPLDPTQQKLLKLEKDFDLAMKSGKSTSRRRKKDDEDIDTELDESAARFVAKMQEAAFADIDAKLNKKAALEKVKMLEIVKTQMNKSHVHNTFLDNGILESMKLWLEPLQDASLPSLDIIQDFLDILDTLPIQTHHLSTSGVGRVVFFYTKVDESRVTPAIKRKAQALVDKWSRPIVKLSQDYRTKKIQYAEGDHQSTTQRRRYDHAAAAAASSSEPAQRSMGVRVPQSNHHSYALMPESTVTYDKSRSGKSDKYKKLKSHMAKIKQIKRSTAQRNISIHHAETQDEPAAAAAVHPRRSTLELPDNLRKKVLQGDRVRQPQLFLIEANDCNRFKEAETAMVAGFGKRATRPTWLMDTSIQRVQIRDVAAAIKQASNDEYCNYNETWMQVDEKEEVEKLETTEKAKYCTSSENVFSCTMTEDEKAGRDEDDVLAELVALLELRSLRREMNLEAAAASGGTLAEDSLLPSPERDRVHPTFTFTGSQRQHDTAIRGGDDDDEDDEEEEEEDRVLSTPPEEMGRTRV